MKKILFLFAITAISLATFAQSTSPRFGTTPGRDNTFRTLTNKVSTLTDAAGNDTLTVTPNAFQTFAKITIVDSVSISFATTYGYRGDTYRLDITGASGTHYVRFTGSGQTLGSTGDITLNSGKGCSITFMFNGSKWIEQCRSLQ